MDAGAGLKIMRLPYYLYTDNNRTFASFFGLGLGLL